MSYSSFNLKAALEAAFFLVLECGREWLALVADSMDRRNTLVKTFGWCFIV